MYVSNVDNGAELTADETDAAAADDDDAAAAVVVVVVMGESTAALSHDDDSSVYTRTRTRTTLHYIVNF